MEFPNDLGGKPGFGAIPRDDRPYEPWELRTHALAIAVLIRTGCGTPRFRHSMERMEPSRYLSATYYEKWLTAVATLAAEYGLAQPDELAGVPRARPDTTPPLGPPGDDVTTPRFAVGDAVVVKTGRPAGHTRCPGFVRGHRGVVVRSDGPSNYDDVEAHADGPRREPLYSVAFDAAELWGDGAEPATVHVDLFDDYLEAV